MLRRLVIGIDVGGTFTDVFALDEASGACTVGKVPTTRHDPAQGVLDGIRRVAADLGAVATVVHGTTVGTNALIERTGAATGLITTAGFRDVLEMRRRDRPQTWGLWGRYEPVVPRDRRLEVNERTLADGSIRTSVDPAEVEAAAEHLLASGAQAIAVVFINSYANAENERRAVAAVRAVWPNAHVAASHEILPEIREFERTSTTALNAYLQPLVGQYIARLEDGLAAARGQGKLLIVQSNGGVTGVDTAKRLPVRTALSGPAAGVVAAAHIAASAGFANVITCDMGGTSFDVSLIADSATALAAEASIDFGLTVRTPMIEITTIGAGGGSIAFVDGGGILQVGPHSAGAEPGPACYGLGNDRPTVTDANVLTGRIDAARPIGGKIARLDADAARHAIATHVGKPLGLDEMAAAEAIIRVANSRMAGAIRLVSIERGHDPRAFVAMPFGGGGALHAGALIKEVGLAKALIPRHPGVTSALGCVIADVRHDFVTTVNRLLDEVDVAALGGEVRRLTREGAALVEGAKVQLSGCDTLVELDMSYVGQTHTVAVTLAGPLDAAAIRAAFEARYRAAYGRLLEGIAMRVLNLRVAVIGRRPKLDLIGLAPKPGGSVQAAQRGTRRVYVDGRYAETPVYARLDLPAGAVVPGPAILEQPDTTILIDAGLAGSVDRFGNVILERNE
ncbi:MAG TPA: hydantoinase/oxoprolinase family protein [Xanthobacteraceae bacterium]|nr:hydantoinase/oxoprolinase family protein [Xanthobacteraceae bacterium]